MRSQHSPQRSVTFWAGGLAMFWALAILLLLPWVDYGKSYRPVARSLQASLPKHRSCIASQGLGEHSAPCSITMRASSPCAPKSAPA